MKCHKSYDAEYVFNSDEKIPKCECGGIIKPDVVLYEESLDDRCLMDAVELISNADCLIVAGTSLTVFPASGLIRYYNGNKLVLINKGATPYDNYANLVLNEKLGDVFSKVEGFT